MAKKPKPKGVRNKVIMDLILRSPETRLRKRGVKRLKDHRKDPIIEGSES